MTHPTIPLTLVQRVGRAAVAILDQHPEMVALTGRAKGNLVPWKVRASGRVPSIAYLVVTGSHVDRVLSRWRITVQFTASAATEDAAAALVGVVERAFTTLALSEVAAPVGPLSADVVGRSQRTGDFDPGDSAARADLDVTLLITPVVPPRSTE